MLPPTLTLELADEAATGALGARIARVAPAGAVIYLHGDLGAGKTTLARGFLRALGYEAAVRSPTFTLLEPYDLGDLTVVHIDLYRVVDPEELEFLGLRDYLASGATLLVEWPGQGAGFLPLPDLTVTLAHQAGARRAVLLGSNRPNPVPLAGLSS